MKPKNKLMTEMLKVHLPSIVLLILVSLNCSAQWTTSGTNIYNSNTGNVGIGTITPASKFNVIGESRFGASGNYVKMNSSGVLSFVGTGNYNVAANKYFFKQSSSGNRGLYINKTNKRFELRDSSSNDLFHVDYYKGDGYFKGKLGVGTTSAIPAESNLVLGGHDTHEGGQIQFNSPTSGYTKAWFMDAYDDYFRIMDGTNSASNLCYYPYYSGRMMLWKDNGISIHLCGTPLYADAVVTVVSESSPIGSLTASGWMSTSDAKMKTNIKPLENSLDKIMKLQGVSFNWKKLPDTLNQIGFIAQEVEKVFPEVVRKDSAGNYSMAIQNLVAPVVEAIKEQQKELGETDESLNNLQDAVGDLQNESSALSTRLDSFDNALSQCCSSYKSGAISSELSAGGDAAKLEQNSPNPFNGKTIIRCYIPPSASQAVIKVYAMSGEEITSLPVNDKGVNQLEISAGTLSSGTYTYLLIVDGKTIDTRQMILTK